MNRLAPQPATVPERFETGVFTVSLDFELLWGTIDRPDREYFRKLCEVERQQVVDEILHLFGEFQVPATWCTVGHLLLDSCTAGVDHHAALSRPERARDPRLLLDPHSSESRDPLLYGRDLINRVRACPTSQEIGAHSFTHLSFTDPMCTRETLAGELEASRRAAESLGLSLYSFAFPRNRVAHVDLLAQYGYTIFRSHDASWYQQTNTRGARQRLGHAWDIAMAAVPPAVMPSWHPAGLWKIPGSMLFTPGHGMREFIPVSRRVCRAHKGLDAAATQGRVFHLWFHPTDLTVRPDAMLAGLRQVLERACALRDAGRLVFLPMRSIPNLVTRSEPRRPGNYAKTQGGLQPALNHERGFSPAVRSGPKAPGGLKSTPGLELNQGKRQDGLCHSGGGRKVLMISTNLGRYGGAEEQVMQLAVALHRRDWKVTIVSLLPPGELSADLLKAGIPVHSLKMRSGVPDPRGVLRLRAIVDRLQPDIVHSHMTCANLVTRVARPISRIPVLICTLHGLQMYRVRGGSTRFREIGHRLTDRWADITTTVCQAAADLCIQNGSVPKGKVIVVPNGIDTKLYRPDSCTRDRVRRSLGIGDEFMWLAVGRLEWAKDYDTMLDAFALMRNHAERNVLAICGLGSGEAKLRHKIQALGLEKTVHLLGFRDDIPELLTAGDGYVMSSRTEGLPLVLLQASAAGLPIIATRVGGNSEVVTEGLTGYLAPPNDAGALSQAMLRLVELPSEQRIAMGLAGRARTDSQFLEERIVERWEELYHKLFEGSSLHLEQA